VILYTVVPPEEIWEEDGKRRLVMASVKGCPVLVEALGEGRGRIERVLSTDPQHFIDPALQPGQAVILLPAGDDVRWPGEADE